MESVQYQLSNKKIDPNIRDYFVSDIYKERIFEIIRSFPNSILKSPALLV